jgi:hypothetical protein
MTAAILFCRTFVRSAAGQQTSLGSTVPFAVSNNARMRRVGRSEAETILQPRGRTERAPEERRHSAANGGTRDRLPPARRAFDLARGIEARRAETSDSACESPVRLLPDAPYSRSGTGTLNHDLRDSILWPPWRTKGRRCRHLGHTVPVSAAEDAARRDDVPGIVSTERDGDRRPWRDR